MSVQKAAKNRCDRLFSLIVRQLDHCEHCGEDGHIVQLQCAHWISRRYSWTRTDFDNAFCLCAACHRWFTDHPTEWGRWATGQRGEDTYQRLLSQSQRRNRFDWVAELERLKVIARGEGVI